MNNHFSLDELHKLSEIVKATPKFTEETYREKNVMRGLRDQHGTGVITGLTDISDVIFAARHTEYYYAAFDNSEKGAEKTKFVSDFCSQYYIRLSVADTAGVLSKISGVFGKYNISIKEVFQVAAQENVAQVIVTTHECMENSVKKSLDKLNGLEEVIKVNGCIRIED